MRSEAEQFIDELREKQRRLSQLFSEAYPLSLTPEEIYQQRQQHGIKKYLPLSELINFIEVIEIVKKVIPTRQLEEFFRYFSFNDSIIELLEQRFHAKVNPGELEDDIYRQNPNRCRSIVELTANSLDADSKQINIVLLNGGYQIVDDGVGMTPEIIFYQLLLPKASNKVSEQTIGRFGLGFFTALAHLQTPDDAVFVSTRAQNQHGYCIELRKINNQFVIHLHQDDTISLGTFIEVRAANIHAEEMTLYLKQHLSYCYGQCPIFLNGAQINVEKSVLAERVSHSRVFFLPSNKTNQIILTINGITISHFTLEKDTHTTSIVWDLPAKTTLSESRNQVRLDTDEIREEMKRLINFADGLPDIFERFRYYNSIAPLIVNLQENNGSLLAKNDVLLYLKRKILFYQKGYCLVPDEANFRSVKIENSLYVDKRLLSHGWQESVSAEPIERLPIGTQVCVLPMQSRSSGKIAFFTDDKARWLFVEKRFYTRCMQNEKWKWDLLCSLPPGEIQVISGTQAFAQKSQAVAKEHPVFNYINPPAEPLHRVFQKHALLAESEDSVLTERVVRAHQNVLLQSPSLMARYSYGLEIPMYSENIYSYYYEGERFYLFRSGYEEPGAHQCEGYLLNQHFRPIAFYTLGGIQARTIRNYLLLIKIRECIRQKQMGGEVHFDPHEVFLLSLPGRKYLVVNSAREILLSPEKIQDHPEQCIALGTNYFAILWYNPLEQNQYTIFDRQGREITSGKGNISACWHDEHVIIVSDKKMGSSSGIEEITVKALNFLRDSVLGDLEKEVFAKIETSNGFYIGFHCWSKFHKPPTAHHFSIYDSNGKHIITYQKDDLSLPEQLRIQYIDCQRHNENYIISLLYDNGSTRLFIVDDKKFVRDIDPKWVLGFPAAYYFDEKRNQIYDIQSGNFLSYALLQMIPSSREMVLQSAYTYEHGKKTITETIRENIFVVQMVDSHCIKIFFSRFAIDWPEDLSLSHINGVEIVGNHLILRGTDEQFYLLSQEGKILAQGKKIETPVYHGVRFFIIDHSIVITESNRVWIENRKIETILEAYFPDPCLIINFETGPFSKNACCVYTLEGQLRQEFQDCLHFPDALSSFRKVENLHTVHSVMLQSKVGAIRTESDITALRTPYGYFTYYYNSSDLWHLFYVAKTVHASCIRDEVDYFDRIVYTPRGYPISHIRELYAELKPLTSTIYFYCKSEYLKPKKAYFLQGLSTETLNNDEVITNLAYLNQQDLTIQNYELSLRFIRLPAALFKALCVFMPSLHYVPTSENEYSDYSRLLEKIKLYELHHQMIIVKLFDLIYERFADILEEEIANKIIHIIRLYDIEVIDTLYMLFSKDRSLDWMTLLSNQFDRLPQLLGQLAYFLVFSARKLLASEASRFEQHKRRDHPISLLNLITAIHLDKTVIEKIQDRTALLTILQRYDHYNSHHIQRRLMHAVYHQAAPNKHLYLREFLQNAMDAYAAYQGLSNEIPTIKISTLLSFEGERCVLRLEDKGIGMSLEQVFCYFLVPGASTKRVNEHHAFIGGRGVGLFTAYHGAHCIRVKTSQGDGQTHYVELYPQYDEATEIIQDIHLHFWTQAEIFKGTLIEREAGNTEAPVLMAALYRRSLYSHAAFIDANIIRIILNEEQVNRTMPVMHTQTIPDFGPVTLYQSKENVITAGGLYVKSIPPNWFECVPKRIQNVLFKHGCVIDFPKNTELNRERNDFLDCARFEKFILQNHLPMYFLYAYIRLFLRGEASLEELPYDFFERFTSRIFHIANRNPRIEEDADQLNRGGILANMQNYLGDLQAFTDLLCFLKIIPYQHTEGAAEEKLSLLDMAVRYHQGMLNKERVPRKIRAQIYFAERSKNALHFASECVRKFDIPDAYLNQEWQPSVFGGVYQVQLFFELVQKVAHYFDPKINIFFSTEKNEFSAQAYADRNGTFCLYWVLINANEEIEKLFSIVCAHNFSDFQRYLKEVIETVSHEYTHMLEGSDHATHNRSFYLRQREILLNKLDRFDAKTLFEHFCERASKLDSSEKCDSLVKQESMLVRFLRSQFGVLDHDASSAVVRRELRA